MQPRLYAHTSGLKRSQTSSRPFRQAIITALLLAVAAPGLLLAAWHSAQAARAVTVGAKAPLAASALKPALALVDENQPPIGPGIPQVGSNAPRSHASSTKAGSVLFFHRYTSSSAQNSSINTLLSLTNTNPRDGVTVRLFLVSDCLVKSSEVNLSPSQTATLLASDLDADHNGYIIATAIDGRGVPTQFNWLIGAATMRDSLGHEATYNAFSVAKRTGGAVNAADGAVTADLLFDGTVYDQLPKNVAVDNIPVQTGPAAAFSDVILYSPSSNLTDGIHGQTIQFNGIAYEQNGTPYLKAIDGSCGTMQRLTDVWPELLTIVTPEKPAWANFAATDLVSSTAAPMLGLSLTDKAGVPLHNARNMQVLSWLPSYRITVPATPPDNPAPVAPTSDQALPTGTATGISENKPGSLLLYANFASGQFGSSQINLTNTNKVEKTRVRVFFVGLNPVGDPAAPPPAFEKLVTLFPTQSLTINAQDVAPDQRGWVLAVAIDNTALPRQFNYLIGSAQVMEATGQAATFNALGIAKYTDGSVPRNDDVLTSDLKFDDLEYDRLPATVAMTALPAQSDVTTLFGFRRPNDNLTLPSSARGSGNIQVFDDLLHQVSGVMGPYQTTLSSIKTGIPSAPITKNLTSGHRGWLKLQSSTPVFAWFSNLASISFSILNTGTWAGGHSGGANLFILTTADSFLIRTASTNPATSAPTAIAETIGVYVEQRTADGTIVRLDGRASHAEDPAAQLKYAWYVDDVLVSTAKVGDYRLSRGQHYVKLIVTDPAGIPSAPDEQFVEVRDTTLPVISGLPSTISKMVSPSSPGAFISYDLPVAWDAIDGAVSVSTSKNSGTSFLVGKTTVTFTARDSAGNVATATLTVNVTRSSSGGTFPQQGGKAGDLAPKMANINDQYVPAGTTRDLVLQATDDDGDAVSFTVQGLPAFAQIVDVNPIARKATLRITPVPGAVGGSTNARVIASDGKGFSVATVPFRILIDEVPNDDTGSGGGGGGGGDDGGGGGGGGGGGWERRLASG